ncbi:MAG: phage holin family protein [Hyphomicrobiales bacterium]|nr:phage holin family protein [Hyphomicrobiales bacterium]
MNRDDPRSIADLIGDALTQGATLLRNEAELARAELAEKFATAARGATLVVVGLAFVIPAITLLLAALAAGLMLHNLAPWLACLIAACVGFVIAGVAIAYGASRFSAERLTPKATLDQIRRDREAAQELTR